MISRRKFFGLVVAAVAAPKMLSAAAPAKIPGEIMFECKPVPGVLYWSKNSTLYDYPMTPEECFIASPRYNFVLTGLKVPDEKEDS